MRLHREPQRKNLENHREKLLWKSLWFSIFLTFVALCVTSYPYKYLDSVNYYKLLIITKSQFNNHN
jgi:hypothetical protein